MVAEVFSKSEAHHEAITSGCFDDGKTILCYRPYCHACGASAPRMRKCDFEFSHGTWWYHLGRFECDGRGDINLCDMCYILWGGDVMKIAYKCSRVLLPGAWNPVGQGPCRLVHYGVTCAECGVSPIRGRRYHCDFCTEYDLCEGCYKEEANRKHRETHLFTLVVKPVKVWTVQMREPKGTLMSTIPCERCGQLPVGGATYSTVALPDSHYCLPCYREGLRFEALCVRGPYNAHYYPVNRGALKIRQRKLEALEDSLASSWLMQPLDRQLKGEEPFPLEPDFPPNPVLWADEPPRVVKPHHRTLLYPSPTPQ